MENSNRSVNGKIHNISFKTEMNTNNDMTNNLDNSNDGDIPAVVVQKPTIGSIDHLAISKSLGYQIFRKSRRNAWTSDEDKCLKKLLVEQYLKKNKLSKYNNEQIDIKLIDWFDIATKMMTKRKGKECKKRWVSSLDPFLRKGKWTKDEDDALISAFKKHGPSWQKVASEIEGRNEDQCSKRYTEVLNSDTKERLKPWSIDEDLILISQVKQFGTKWRQISNFLPSRPSLTCRNRWRKIMTDIAKDCASDTIKKAVGVLDENGKPVVKFTKSENSKNLNTNTTTTNNNNNDTTNTTNNSKAVAVNNIEKSKPDNILKPLDNIMKPQDVNDEKYDNKNGSSPNIKSNSKTSKKRSLDDNESNTNPKRHNNNSENNTPATDSFSPSNSFPRMATPLRTQTDWKFSLIDPRTNEEMNSYSGSIKTQELAHYLIELARFNGVSLTVHQHIHHHYSAANVPMEPQNSISRYGHFNYLPPLTEVPKLTSSSSPDNTVDSSNSNKAYGENSLLRLLNNDEVNNSDNINNNASNIKNSNKKSTNNNTNNTNNNNNTTAMITATTNNNEDNNRRSKDNYPRLHRQQLYPSNSSNTTPQSQPLSFEKNRYSTNTPSNNIVEENKNNRKNYLTEDLDEELDFWETMRSISHPKNNKPVSQHHPLHYYQPSNYKEQFPYQPSDSFGIQRFPNMATPPAINIMNTDGKNSRHVQTTITNVNTDSGYGGMYVTGNECEQYEEEEDEIDIANQYGMYYSVFTNKGQGSYGSGRQPNSDNANDTGATGLVNSGYLMPFNPS